jgi:CheY-like chemotaxis protein
VAGHGIEALERLQAERFDLVLMDVQMPIQDGIVAVGRIRALEREGGGHVPIVALTAHAMEEDRLRLLNSGFDGYLAKPTRIRELLAEMKRCLAL